MTTARAACHCTKVRFEVPMPEWVLDCNCTLCRRYGALWTYPDSADVEMVAGEGETDTYLWQQKILAFHYCKTCGCVTHFTALDRDPPPVVGVNARMIPTLDPANVAVRQIDNGHTGVFWTPAGADPIESRHPEMPKPGPEDWR